MLDNPQELVDPSNLTGSTRSDRARNRGRSFESLQITHPQIQRQKDHAGETTSRH